MMKFLVIKLVLEIMVVFFKVCILWVIIVVVVVDNDWMFFVFYFDSGVWEGDIYIELIL